VTEVAFHFGAPDKLAYTCRLLRKASATGARLLVRSPADVVAALDAALWNLRPADFVTHCDTAAPQSVQERSGILLQPAGVQIVPGRPILVNLAQDVPQGFAGFQRVIEVVSNEEEDRDWARKRWMQYKGQGFAITRHDLASQAGD
jgi:DNA polymerase-3 subunit chi